MEWRLEKTFVVLQVIALEHVSGISLKYDENTCERQSTCSQAVLRFHIWLKEMFSNSILFGLIENYDQSAAVLISAVSLTREDVRWVSKGVVEREILGIQATIFLGVNNFGNI